MFLSALSILLSSWTKERRVLLVKSFEKKKWVVVRPLPFSRTYPQQYDVSQSFVDSIIVTANRNGSSDKQALVLTLSCGAVFVIC